MVGPTAAGKSALAMALAERTGGEIIAADSVQVYRGLDIGSAKPTAVERARVPHHGLDLFDPREQSDAGRWLAAAEAALDDIAARGRRAIVCGGTGLYIRALLEGLAATPEVPEAVRAAVLGRLLAEGPERVHAALAEVDAETAARVAPRDAQRVGRALSVFLATGRPLSAWQADHRAARAARAGARPPVRILALWPERPTLYARIDARAAAMVAGGLVEETRGLLAQGVPASAPGLQCLGYREARAVLAGELPHAALAERVALGHRRYAKRQLTWFRRLLAEDARAEHLDPLALDVVERALAL